MIYVADINVWKLRYLFNGWLLILSIFHSWGFVCMLDLVFVNWQIWILWTYSTFEAKWLLHSLFYGFSFGTCVLVPACVCLWVCLHVSVYWYVCLYMYLSVSVCFHVCLPSCLSLCLSMCLSGYVPVFLPVFSFTRSSVYLRVCPCACLTALSPSACLSVWIYARFYVYQLFHFPTSYWLVSLGISRSSAESINLRDAVSTPSLMYVITFMACCLLLIPISPTATLLPTFHYF